MECLLFAVFPETLAEGTFVQDLEKTQVTILKQLAMEEQFLFLWDFLE